MTFACNIPLIQTENNQLLILSNSMYVNISTPKKFNHLTPTYCYI